MVIREETRAGFARIAALQSQAARETRDHFDIVAAALRDDLKKLAEAQVATTERIDRLEQKMDRGFAEVRGDIAALVQTLGKRRRR